MRYFLDTEFNQVGTFVELISIGIVCDDGREYYAQNAERHKEMDQSFVVERVLPLFDDVSWDTVAQIREEVTKFILPNGKMNYAPEIWAWFGNYDWVAFCGTIYGNMVAVPDGMPWNIMDLKQYADYLGITTKPESPKGEHNALVDARWNKAYYEYLVAYDGRQRIEWCIGLDE